MREICPEDFLPRQPPQPLSDDEIHLWFFPQWKSAAAAAESTEMRRILAAYLGVNADSLRIVRAEHGKPRIACARRLQFNLSHGGGGLLLALSRGLPLGVDLEASRRSRPVLELAHRYFNQTEAAALAALPEPLRQAAFLRLWSCKEAVLKAHGRGIGYGLDRVVFDLDATGEVVGMRMDAPDELSTPWQVVRLAPTAIHIGALAWRGRPCVVRSFAHAQL